MTAAPSVSNSITVRLELPARPTAVSELSTLIERAGGLVSGLDVTASGGTTCTTCGSDAKQEAEMLLHVDRLVRKKRRSPGQSGTLELFVAGP